jgi:ketosteroid isomerase-like protein
MRYLFTILFFAFASVVFSQNKEEQQVTEKVMAVHKAVFVDKDSLALENLLAPEITYGHSHGKLQNRKEMIDGASHNKSTYTNIAANNISVIVNGNTAVSRYLLTGTETSKDGKVTQLKLNILQVWVKEKKDWKMLGRQAVAIE